ncbi:unnamed protein product [Lupinus luteus]|uniref:Uncharacterized protein n=1 Tax=Lupinus luteus TaxID=3873 RepID=A0AAV1XTK4_LUPLU
MVELFFATSGNEVLAPGERKFVRGLDRRGGMEEKARDGVRSLCASRMRCPPRRATRSVVLSHKISTSPASWPGESKFSFGQLSTQSSAKNKVESRNTHNWCASYPRGKKSDKV